MLGSFIFTTNLNPWDQLILKHYPCSVSALIELNSHGKNHSFTHCFLILEPDLYYCIVCKYVSTYQVSKKPRKTERLKRITMFSDSSPYSVVQLIPCSNHSVCTTHTTLYRMVLETLISPMQHQIDWRCWDPHSL